MTSEDGGSAEAQLADGDAVHTCRSDAGHHHAHVAHLPRRLTAPPGVNLFPGRGEHPSILVVGEPLVPRQLADGAAAAPRGHAAVTHRRAGDAIALTHLRMGHGDKEVGSWAGAHGAQRVHAKKAGMRHEDAEEHRRATEHELWAWMQGMQEFSTRMRRIVSNIVIEAIDAPNAENASTAIMTNALERRGRSVRRCVGASSMSRGPWRLKIPTEIGAAQRTNKGIT